MPTFSLGRLAMLGWAPVSAQVAERAVAVPHSVKVAERAADVLQPAAQMAAERFLREVEVPDSAGVVGLRAARALAEQIFSPGQEEFSRAVAPLACRPLVDPPFSPFRPVRTLLCLRRPPVTRAHS